MIWSVLQASCPASNPTDVQTAGQLLLCALTTTYTSALTNAGHVNDLSQYPELPIRCSCSRKSTILLGLIRASSYSQNPRVARLERLQILVQDC